MFLVAVLLLLCSGWWSSSVGCIGIVAMSMCLYFWPRQPQEIVIGGVLLCVGYLYWLPFFVYHHMGGLLISSACVALLVGISCVLFFCVVGWFYWYACRQKWSPFVIGMMFSVLFLVVSRLVPVVALLNPLLPALSWARASFVQEIPASLWTTINKGAESFSIYYLPPRASTTRHEALQQVYKALCAIEPPPSASASTHAIIVSPESLFPYHIEDDVLTLWRSALPPQTLFIFGASYASGSKNHQAFFIVTKSPITARYEKEQGIVFFEFYPTSFITQKVERVLFPSQAFLFSPGVRYQGGWHEQWEPMLCSDLLWKKPFENKRVVVGINELWLPPWLQKIWLAYGIWYSLWFKQTLLWVGHTGCWLVS